MNHILIKNVDFNDLIYDQIQKKPSTIFELCDQAKFISSEHICRFLQLFNGIYDTKQCNVLEIHQKIFEFVYELVCGRCVHVDDLLFFV
jgi:hypothetical protein